MDGKLVNIEQLPVQGQVSQEQLLYVLQRIACNPDLIDRLERCANRFPEMERCTIGFEERCRKLIEKCDAVELLCKHFLCSSNINYSQRTIDEYSNRSQIKLNDIVTGLGGDFVNGFPVPPGKKIRLTHKPRPGYTPTNIRVDLNIAGGGQNYSDFTVQFYLVPGGVNTPTGLEVGNEYDGNIFLNKDGTQMSVPFPEYPRISNSDGASLASGRSLSVYANSHGFIGRERGSSHSLSCALIAGRDEAMQRDYCYTASCHPDELQDAATVGRRAAERAIARLQPGAVQTGRYPVLFAPEVARSLFGHLLSAVSGSALYRRASFLLDSMGTQVLPNWLSLRERPFLLRGQRSAAFDAEGVATCDSDLVHEGVLSRYVLGSYSARKLGLQSTANAGGVHNLLVQGRGESFETLLGSMSRGLLVTELMGQGVSTLTGDYSRGAAGFWVESGQIAWPVDEATIAGNLRDMFLAIEAVGSDVDTRSHLRTGSVLIGQMTVAGAAD